MKIDFRSLALGASATALVVGLTACGVNTVVTDDTALRDVDGVQCVVYKNSEAGGIDCNWEAYNAK